MDDEHYEDLTIVAGLPGPADFARWRKIVSDYQFGTDYELSGIKEGPNGTILGIFRKSVPAGA